MKTKTIIAIVLFLINTSIVLCQDYRIHQTILQSKTLITAVIEIDTMRNTKNMIYSNRVPLKYERYMFHPDKTKLNTIEEEKELAMEFINQYVDTHKIIYYDPKQ